MPEKRNDRSLPQTSKKLTNYFKRENDAFILVVSCCVYYFENKDESVPLVHPVQKDLHFHTRYEYHVALNGECIFETEGGKKYVLKNGEFIIFPPKVKHRILYESHCFSKILVSFDFDPIKSSYGEFYKTFAQCTNDMKIYKSDRIMQHLENEMVQDADNRRPDYPNMVSALLEAYIIAMARTIVGNSRYEGQEQFDDDRVFKAVEFIKRNCMSDINTADVARHVFLSSKQILRLFKRYIDKSPSEYITQCRMENVRKLLDETDLRINEIADLMNFPDAVSMIKKFKKYEGITPGKYRKWDN